MLSFNLNRENCTGCSACYSICPISCISMIRDEEGFLYPVSNDTCIACGLCEKVCPIITPKQLKNSTHDCYAAISKKHNLWKNSTSGGAFSEICNTWCDEKTLIIGASWDKLVVHHIGVIGPDKISPLRKSKYVESAIEEVFSNAKMYLDNGNKVLFSGTPCQVSGLKSFLRKDYSSLLTIDLICHGVGSQRVFDECIKFYERERGEKVNRFEFRAKRDKYETDHLSLISTESTKRYLINDRYNQLFLDQYCLRPSCGKNCKFRNTNRQGDITLADFKGLNKVFPNLGGELYNYSTIIFNNEKGKSISAKLQESMNLYACKIEDIIKYNPLFAGQTWYNNQRDAFFADFIVSPLDSIAKWTHEEEDFKQSFKRKLFNFLPKKVRSLLSVIYTRIK